LGAPDREAVLQHLRAGRTIMDAVAATRRSYGALSNARKADPDYDAAVIDPREAGARAVSRVTIPAR